MCVLVVSLLSARSHKRKANEKTDTMTTTNELTAHSRHKRMLAAKGWSYRTAAPVLGVHWTHLNRVLQGERQSAALLKRIEAMPKREARPRQKEVAR